MKKKIAGITTVCVILIFTVVLFCMCFHRVPAGYVGVVYTARNGVTDESVTAGWHILPPTKDITLYSIGIEQSYLTHTDDGDSRGDDSFEVPTSDGKGLVVDLTFTYRFDESKVCNTFVRFKGRNGKEVRDVFIKPNIMAWTKEVTARYPVTAILGDQRATINTDVYEYVAEKFKNYGIIIESASIIDINADDNTRAEVQKKVAAQQEYELAQIEAKTSKINANKEKEVALIQAEKKKEVAALEAETKKIQAEADAEATKIAAEAEAVANKEISESLTPELIDKLKYEAWDGSLPQVQGNSNPIIKLD